MRKLLLVTAISLIQTLLFSQSISLTGPATSENFNTLAVTGPTATALPNGWYFVETGTGANTSYGVDGGASTSGNTYSYGAAADADRAFGGLQSGSTVPSIGASFTNNTGAPITSLLISYTGEQWRAGTAGRADRIDFQYSTDATAINNGTWTDVNTLDFNSVNNAAVGALDGNAAANRLAISATIAALNIPDGATVFIRWQSFDASGSDDGLAIDDFSITPGAGASSTISIAATTNAAEPSSNGLFTITLSSSSPTDVTTAYTVTGTATAGTDYNTLSGTVTIPAGSSSVTIPVVVIDDNLPEPTETVIVTLNTVSSPYIISNAAATINITSEDVALIQFNGSYTQDFNTLATTGLSSAVPDGWVFSETGTNGNLTYTAGDGASNSGNTYSFGTGVTTDRAFGGIRSGSLIPVVGGLFKNTTGSTVTSLAITYTGEQWRLGTTGRNDRLDFQYSLNNNSISSGAFTDVDGLDFIAPVSSGTAGPLDGNAANHRKLVTLTIYGLVIPDGSIFALRWTDFDVTGAEDGLAIDDLTITLGCTPPTNQPTSLVLTPALQSVNGSFTAAAAGGNDADAYLVLVSTSPTLTAEPLSGTTYAIDDAVGNARVISIGNNLSFTGAGLTPSTTYYFFVYGTADATDCYNITNPLTGSVSTTAPPPCVAPVTQASGFTALNVTGTGVELAWTRGSGDNIIVIARTGAPVDAIIYNSLAYPAGTTIGNSNTVIYNGPAGGFTYSGLTQNTTYHLALYEYNDASTCYLSPALTGSFTTLCTSPVNVSGLSASGTNASVTITFAYPASACSDEVIVVASTSPINTPGSAFSGPANALYTSGEQVVYRGTGSGVTVTGLTNGTVYYLRVFTRKGTDYSVGVQTTATPFDPASGYTYLYGNLHAHSAFSDGNKDTPALSPDDDFAFGRDALCMDFMGISEHNHAGAGMSLPNYLTGFNEANSLNLVPGPGGNSIVTLWGMEWGTISGGGHVLIYGFDDDLLGWEPGNYDILTPKNDHATLWPVINNRSGAFATLAHPNPDDYTNLLGNPYNATADAAVAGVAIESGPAFSTSLTYNDFPASLSFLSYYRGMLAKGYKLAPQMDQDNHNLTFGTANANRMVVLAAGKDRNSLMDGIRSMRYYASQDCNLRLDLRAGASPMGSSVSGAGLPVLSLTTTDLDAELTTSIELWGGPAGGAIPSAALKTYPNTAGFTFNAADAQNIQPDVSTWYYYVVVTQEDGNKAVSAPIWYYRDDLALPLTLISFTGKYDETADKVILSWNTAQEVDTKSFVIERSGASGSAFSVIGTVNAAGNAITHSYQFQDLQPLDGTSRYRLKMIDIDGRFTYSPLVTIRRGATGMGYTVSPNPVHGTTWVRASSPEPELATVSVLDNNGRVLLVKRAAISSSNPLALDLTGQPAGLYVVRIEAGGKQFAEKLIVQ